MRLFAGGYAAAGARGLYPLSLEGKALSVGEPVSSVVNVSGGLRVPGTERWFLVDESAGLIRLLDAGDGWRELACVPSGGVGPCHLALDSGTLAAANYENGTVALFALNDEGRPQGTPRVFQHKGNGSDADRQKGPHAHWVGFAHGRLYAADLGADRIFTYSTTVDAAYVAPPGSGPRQLAFHPRLPVAYLVSELASTLTVLRVGEDGALIAARILTTLPPDAGESLGGAIRLSDDASRLYVSNRGHDSIAAFAVQQDGDITLLSHTPTGGSSPRFLLLADGHLLVAHEKSGGVTLLPLDGEGCPSAPVARADVPGAAFLGVLA